MPSSNPFRQSRQSLLRTKALFAIGLALSSGGCSLWQQPPTIIERPVTAVAAPTPQALTPEAAAALDQAKQRVAEARASRTLWKSALEKLIVAEQAAVKQDSQLTLSLASEIISLCQLSTKQASQPPVTW